MTSSYRPTTRCSPFVDASGSSRTAAPRTVRTSTASSFVGSSPLAMATRSVWVRYGYASNGPARSVRMAARERPGTSREVRVSFSGARTRVEDEAAAVRRFVWRLGIRPRLRRREAALLLLVAGALLVGWTSLETLRAGALSVGDVNPL